MPRTLTLPRIAATEAQALSRLARRALELPISRSGAAAQIFQGTPRLTLRHLGLGTSPLNPEDAVRSRIEWSGCRLALDVPKSAAEDWMRAVMGGEPAASMPGPWRVYALEQGLRWLVETLSACGKGAARMVESGLAASGPVEGTRHQFLLSLDFEDPSTCIQAVLHCDNLGLLMLAGLVPSNAADVLGALSLSGVPVRLHLTLGCTDLRSDQWRQLAPGDVVFILRPFFDGPAVLALRVQVPNGPTWRFMAQHEGLTLTVTSEALAMIDSADQPDQDDGAFEQQANTAGHESDEQAPPPLGSLMIRLSFDVGHKDVSIDELSRFQPGEVLTLERPIGEIVTLRANGAVVGKGTLVEVDGRVGVLLTDMASGGARP